MVLIFVRHIGPTKYRKIGFKQRPELIHWKTNKNPWANMLETISQYVVQIDR